MDLPKERVKARILSWFNEPNNLNSVLSKHIFAHDIELYLDDTEREVLQEAVRDLVNEGKIEIGDRGSFNLKK